MKNLINDLPELEGIIKAYGITELFIHNEEVYCTSNYILPQHIVDMIEEKVKEITR